MKRWHLPTLEASSDKRTAREPGAVALRVPTVDAQPRSFDSGADTQRTRKPSGKELVLEAAVRSSVN